MPGVISPTQVGQIKDIRETVIMAKAEMTPFLSMLPRGPAPSDMLYEFQGSLVKNTSKRGVPDGQDVTSFQDHETRAIISARVQRMQAPYQVGKLRQTVSNVAGRKNRLAKEIDLALERHQVMTEELLLDATDSRPEDGVNGSEVRGFFCWTGCTTQTDLPVPTAHATPATSRYTGAYTAITEDTFKGILKSIWKQRRRKTRRHGFVGVELKQKISEWASYQTALPSQSMIRRNDGVVSDKRIVEVIDIIETDTGILELHLCPNLARDRAGEDADTLSDLSNESMAIVEMDEEVISIDYNQRPQRTVLPDQGGGPRGFIDSIFGYKCYPRAHGAVYPS